jgi:hypothetical protein
MAAGINVEVKQSGRFRPPKLDGGALTAMGQELVRVQLERWENGLNVFDSKAKPLSKKAFFIKRRVRKTSRPVRDLNMTGLLRSNFTLRKAIDNVIRAEPTSRAARQHARQGNAPEQMIGFAGSDMKAAYDEAVKAWGRLAGTLWYRVP